MSGYWQVIPSCTTKYKVEVRELSLVKIKSFIKGPAYFVGSLRDIFFRSAFESGKIKYERTIF